MYSRIAFAILLLYVGFVLGSSEDLRYPFSEYTIPTISPSDKISVEDLQVFKDKAIINVDNLIWARVKDTHSMEPTLNSDSISLEKKPSSYDDIQIGDIISYAKDQITIIHRVVDISEDDDGWFAITKGDNNPVNDDLRVRFSQVKGVVVGILY